MEVLQTSALPLGYAAMGRHFTPADSICPDGRCQDARPPRGHGTTVERERGFEPPTSTLARLHSTTELLPPDNVLPVVGRRVRICHAMLGASRGLESWRRYRQELPKPDVRPIMFANSENVSGPQLLPMSGRSVLVDFMPHRRRLRNTVGRCSTTRRRQGSWDFSTEC